MVIKYNQQYSTVLLWVRDSKMLTLDKRETSEAAQKNGEKMALQDSNTRGGGQAKTEKELEAQRLTARAARDWTTCCFTWEQTDAIKEPPNIPK